jgi:Phage portal protein, SPP1 Gp6-like
MCSGLGGVFLRIVWDTSVSDKPWIQPVPADMGVPQFAYDKLKAVTFWRVLSDNGTDVIRHLELHNPAGNQIIHGVYQGDQSDLGEIVPYTDWPAEVRQLGDLEGGTLQLPDLPFDASTVAYVPNLRPNKVWRDLGPQAWPLGRSDYSGVEPLMDSLDQTYSYWMRDIQLAVSRLIVPPEYLDNIGRGQGAVFEPDRRVFTPLNMLHDNPGSAPSITMNQFKIRWQEHKETCEDLANRCVQEAGYSPQSFGDYAGGALTATEIEARERTSLMTRQKKIRYWRPVLRDIIYSLMCVSKLYFGASAIEPERPDLVFPPVALPDVQAMAQTISLLSGAEAASKRTLVAMAHPEWSDSEVAAEVRTILSETGIDMAARARIALAAPMGEPLGQAVRELADPVDVPEQSGAGLDAEDDEEDNEDIGS